MAYAKKTAKNEAYQKLKTDLKEGNPLGNAYLFYGEESYLREYYLGEIRKRLIPAGFEEFNYHALEGKDLTAQSLTEMAEAMPMLAELCLPYVKVGGAFLAMKSVDCGRELEEAAHCIKLLGARLEECRDYTIPGTDVIHRLVVLRKVAPTLKGYPRRWAKIQKAPL